MAQLFDDCSAHDAEPPLSVEQAAARAAGSVGPVVEIETVPLAQLDGRVLAADLIAPRDLPPFANAAVDGYAVRAGDLDPRQPSRLRLQGRVIAGDRAPAPHQPGSAVRIFTGAPIPDGCDTVFMQEDVGVEDGWVVLPPGLKPGANLRPAGEDVAAGGLALPAGRRLRPQDVALAAALGFAGLPVRRALRVAVFSTGNELVAPGTDLPPGAQYDSNRFMLVALLRRLGVWVDDFGVLRDAPDAVRAALRDAAAGHDLIVTSGGVSAGEEDHVRGAVLAEGALRFWRLAIKPGRPVAMGHVGGTPFIGLPGNPVAVFVTFVRVARPLIDALAGAAPHVPPPILVTADFSLRKKPGRREYVRVRLRPGPTGGLCARPHPHEGAGMISSLTDSDGLAELPEDLTQVTPGDPLVVFSYGSLI